jgi:hypothetical protein
MAVRKASLAAQLRLLSTLPLPVSVHAREFLRFAGPVRPADALWSKPIAEISFTPTAPYAWGELLLFSAKPWRRIFERRSKFLWSFD